jgi:hypothetical protein
MVINRHDGFTIVAEVSLLVSDFCGSGGGDAAYGNFLEALAGG